MNIETQHESHQKEISENSTNLKWKTRIKLHTEQKTPKEYKGDEPQLHLCKTE